MRSGTGTDDAEAVLTHERAFDELFRAHHRTIVQAAYHRLSNVRDAEDAAAEVFSVAWRQRASAPGIYTLPWLYGVLRNVVGVEYRRRDRARVGAAASAETGRAEDDSADVDAGDAARDVRRAVASLALSDRELIWMAYWEDLSRTEMAEIVGISHASLRVRLLRARHRLKVALDAPGNADPGRRQKP
ncbi:RNA polymerase sigma factor [Agromyces sp. NPDC056965]|uniref:RNA polymerase sigma factor n=1 Tax=Agromyces sp. NPDC056965 TaxID=3345983 RepID=UPI003625580C